MTKQYAERAHECLDRAGNYYCRHVSAMTEEGLHEKSLLGARVVDLAEAVLAVPVRALRAS